IAGRDQDALDRFHGLQVDLGKEQEYARRAKALADQRRKLEDQSLKQLRVAMGAKQKLQDALEARIKDYQDEADAVAKQESSLSSLIRSREVVTRVSRANDDSDLSGRISGAGLMWPVRQRRPLHRSPRPPRDPRRREPAEPSLLPIGQ